MLRNTKMLALAALLSLSAAPAAFAQVDAAVLDRFKAVMAEQGTPISWEKVDTYDNSDGDEVTALMKAKMKVGEEEVGLDTIELSNVTSEKGGYKIGLIAVPQQRFVEGETTVEVADITIEGMFLPPAGQKAPFGGVMMYDSIGVGAINASSKGKEVFSMTDFSIALEGESDTGLSFSGGAEAFKVSFDQVTDPTSKAAIEGMGYQNIEGYFEMAGTWDAKAGNLAVSQYDITVNDAGTLGIAVELGGYTPAFIEQLQKTQAQLAASTNKDDSAAGMAMLGLMQQLTFKSAAITFTDDSLTKKVLDFVAKGQNAKPADIANQAKAIVPFMLMQLNNAELTQAATKAVTDFLDNPKNISIKAAPASPVPFALIVASAMTAPQSLITQLGVGVAANQ